MNPRRQKRLFTGLVLLVGLGITIGLVLYALKSNIDLFYTPNEIVNGKKETGIKPQIGQRLRIGGMVVEGSVKRLGEGLKVQFELADAQSKQNIVIEYDGILPDLFREGQGIVANGYLRSPTKVEAFEVLAKHDEEYMPPDLAEAMKGIKHVKPQNNPDMSGAY